MVFRGGGEHPASFLSEDDGGRAEQLVRAFVDPTIDA
eukprot:SAG22_NODE_13186_length_415_cov_1.129747_1_plen_36_part_10